MSTSIVPKENRYGHYVVTTSGTHYRLGEKLVRHVAHLGPLVAVHAPGVAVVGGDVLNRLHPVRHAPVHAWMHAFGVQMRMACSAHPDAHRSVKESAPPLLRKDPRELLLPREGALKHLCD